MSLNLKALQTFYLIVREGSLAGAAKEMNLSQPAASRLIRILEAETRLQLFSRARRRLVLTVEGELFYREAEHILGGVDEIPEIASDIRMRAYAPLRVMTSVPIGLSLLAPALALFRQEYPDIRCVADIGSRFELESMVGTRRYDLGLVSFPISHSLVELDNEPLCRARSVALLPKGHPLAARDSLAADDLRDQPVIALAPNLLWRHRADDFFRSGGVTPTYAMETQSTLVARQLVINGAGIALLDLVVGGLPASEAAVMRPLDPERWVSYGCVFPKGQPRHANADLFIEALRHVIEARCASDTGDARFLEPTAAAG
jgi:DNA-binding transcriptional LysR family regulator